jgi:alpha-methylacyl-CoA racemase
MVARPPARPAPKLGQDTDALLAELGYDPAAIERLRADGVI